MSVQSFRSALLLAALCTGAVTVPSSLSAQQGARDDHVTPAARISLAPTPAPVDTAHAALTSGPRMAPAGFTAHEAASLAGPARPVDRSSGDDAKVALIGVGAAVVALGLIIGGNGGTIVAVSGGVIGLVSLYRYLR